MRFNGMGGDRFRHSQMRDRWLVRGAIVVVVALQLSMINDFAYGTRWLAPIVEIAVLVPLMALTLRAEVLARGARTSQEWDAATSYRQLNRLLGLALVVVVSAANGRSLLLLLRALLAGRPRDGRALLLDAMNIWITNVIVFSLWYWQLDRGGASIGPSDHSGPSEFIFPTMTLPTGTEPVEPRVKLGYIDYLFLSFTTSTAFSPTDTMPLTARMKLLMMLEASVSLLTLALVAARAVNILA